MANNTVTLQFSDAQAKALEMMGVSGSDVASSAVSSAIKSKLNYYRNGATVKDASEATHSIIKKLKSGGTKTVYYKGGLKAGAVQAYNMAKAFLPKEVSEATFVSSALAEVDAVLASLNGSTDDVEDDSSEDSE